MNKKIGGLLYSYYFLCPKKMWYSANNIDMEHENENVIIGQSIDESSYGREQRHILVDDAINIDFIKEGMIHEIKKSKKLDEMAEAQVKYYLYYLKRMNISVNGAIINYPLLKQRKEVVLTAEDVATIERNLETIMSILENEIPPEGKVKKALCKKCSFHDLCYI